MEFLIFLVIVTIFVGYLISIYNRMVANRNEVDNAFAQIDVQLTRRYDLIPNLIKVAQKYMDFEQETLENVIKARNMAQQALQSAKHDSGEENLKALSEAETNLTQQIGGMYAVFENYPDLKANTQMTQLTEELSSTENKVAFARQHFNDIVTTYNNSIQMFPNVIIANNFGFRSKGLLEIDDIEVKRQNIEVNFD
ncbi:MAG: LemA family protein [Gammaproteobacteria bacterium]|nr:LemA family protein [Gammaproteobacteria bacterium]